MKSKPSAEASAAASTILDLKSHIADVIHMHVLQSLALSQLQIELSRRMCEMGDDLQALTELDVASQQLVEAATVLQQIMHELGVPAKVMAITG